MKKIISSILLLTLAFLWGCKKEGNYPGGTVSPYLAIFDLRTLDKGQELTLNKDNMSGSYKITGLVVSDHSGGNMPAGLLVVQDKRRLDKLRGISIALGPEAANYAPGDSVVIDVEGGVLKRVDGILQLTGITTSDITRVSSGSVVTPKKARADSVLLFPGDYESTLVTLNKVGYDPALPAGSTYAGERTMNDGFGNIILHTEAGADYADSTLPFLSEVTGLVFGNSEVTLQLRPRGKGDIKVLASKPPKVTPIVITGFLTDPISTDGNYEYIQLMATKDIDFSVTGFSVITCNNAGSALPLGAPVNGWATGVGRTYKFTLNSGTVHKGEYFYVGANKNICGAGSTDISTSKWFTRMYVTEAGDGFGNVTTNLLANSGNAAGIAVFDKTTVDAESVPVDVIFYGGNGTLFAAGPPAVGYRITNTDYYDTNNSDQVEQPFYGMGTNTNKLPFPTTSTTTTTNFAQMGGTYNKTTGRWTTGRTLKNVLLTTTSAIAAIEGATTIEE